MVSIIIPLYNKQGQIERCLNSIKDQTFKDWELIIIDDGSTDKSAEIVESFLYDNRIHYYYKQNGGVSSARNMGMKKATGEWIVFLDADDYFFSEALEILLVTAIQNKTLVSAANFYAENKNGRYLQCIGKDRIVKNNFRSWYFMTCYPRAGAVLFHSSVVKELSFDESLSRYEDAKFLFTIMRQEKIAYTARPVMVYSDDIHGLSVAADDPRKDYIFIIEGLNYSFWENIVHVCMVKRNIYLYPGYQPLLCQQSKYTLYYFMESIMSFISPVLKKINKLINGYIRNFIL